MTAASDAARPHWWWALLTGMLLIAGCGEDPTSASPTCATVPELEAGEALSARLDAGDTRFAGARIDYYALQLPDTTTVDIQLQSSAFDPLLFLFRAPDAVLDQAFDSAGAPPGDTETAALTRRLPPGCHLIGASAWTDDATGPYTLRADTASTP